MSGLVTAEIFSLFFNTLTLDVKCSRRHRQIFWHELQTILSQQEKIFCWFFIVFPKCEEILEHCEEKEEYPSLIITEIIASERDVYLSV